MTVAQKMLKDLIEKKRATQTLHEEMCEIESNFDGMEITHNGDWATVNFVDGNMQNVNLYVRDENGNSEHIDLSFEEFQEIL